MNKEGVVIPLIRWGTPRRDVPGAKGEAPRKDACAVKAVDVRRILTAECHQTATLIGTSGHSPVIPSGTARWKRSQSPWGRPALAEGERRSAPWGSSDAAAALRALLAATNPLGDAVTLDADGYDVDAQSYFVGGGRTFQRFGLNFIYEDEDRRVYYVGRFRPSVAKLNLDQLALTGP